VAQRQRKGKPARTGNGAFYGVLGVIALGGVIAIGYALMGSDSSAATELVELDVESARALYERATPITMGSSDAPVKVREFGDFQCPGCGTFSLNVRPSTVDPYVENGQVQFIFYDFPLVETHVHAFLAARAARCAGDQPAPSGAQGPPAAEQGAYWAYHDLLFEKQQEWAYQQGSVVDEFVGYAEELGIDADAFEQCLESDRHADVVTANRRLGEQLGVRGTPTVLVNARNLGAPRTIDLSQAIESALGTQTDEQ
jgi:protein-disulfide isomerase